MKRILFSLGLLFGLGSMQAQTAFDIIQNSPNHNTLEAAVIAAGLDVALATENPITVFAPTDDAFAALPAGTVDALLNDIPTLTDILLYHVVPANVLSTSLVDGQTAPTLNGSNINVTINANGVFINATNQVIAADVVATNGVVHVIDGVLLPPPVLNTTVWDIIQNSPDHNTLEVAVGLAGLDGTLDGPGTFTVFAPTDAAFTALPSPILDAVLADPALLTFILTYHVAPVTALSTGLSDGMMVTTLAGLDVTVTIANGNVFINQAQVTVADIVTDNGVVHVIDAIIAPGIIANNVWDIIESSPAHAVLETAIVAAGLQSTLENNYFYTVFAPTDAAFAALPAGTVESLIADPVALSNVLLYHVAPGAVAASDLVDGQEITMAQGQTTTISLNMGAMINTANIVATDLNAWNGVVHVIDAVLLPPASVEGLAAMSLSAYPNPCENNIIVEKEINGSESFRIYSIAGQIIQEGTLTSNVTSLNVENLSSGMYTIVCADGSRLNFMKK
jgi:uncharacterized surface protein with fasciclin (FAS1) repeats